MFKFLVDLLVIDALIRVWAQPLPILWWQLLAMAILDFMLGAYYRHSVKRTGKQSSSSRRLALAKVVNRLGLISMSLVTMLP
jgi:membrane protein implicated in regulation of membrane protease activity